MPVSDLPPPPFEAIPAPAIQSTEASPARPPEAGELTTGWRIATGFTWVGVILALAAVWNASEQLGLMTWWLGPRGKPQPRFVQLSPFAVPVLIVLATINNAKWLGWLGLAGSAAVATIGVVDLRYVARLGALEIAVGVAAAAVSVASLTGTYRRNEITG